MDSEDRKVLQFPKKGTPENYGPDVTVTDGKLVTSGAPEVQVETVKTYGCRGCNAPPGPLTEAEAQQSRELGHDLYVVGDEQDESGDGLATFQDGQSAFDKIVARMFGGRTPDESGIPGGVGIGGDEPAVLRVTVANVSPETLIDAAEEHGLYGTAWQTVGNSPDGREYGATIEFGGAIVSRVKPFVLAVLKQAGERQAYITRNGRDAILANADGSQETF